MQSNIDNLSMMMLLICLQTSHMLDAIALVKFTETTFHRNIPIDTNTAFLNNWWSHCFRQEGVPNIYQRLDICVTNKDGVSYDCRCYQMVTPVKDGGTPSPQYMDVILKGAVQCQLPTDYIEGLKKMNTNGNTELVQVYEDILKLIDWNPSVHCISTLHQYTAIHDMDLVQCICSIVAYHKDDVMLNIVMSYSSQQLAWCRHCQIIILMFKWVAHILICWLQFRMMCELGAYMKW